MLTYSKCDISVNSGESFCHYCGTTISSLCMQEIFGPVLTIYVYKDLDYKTALHLVDSTTEFALTGSIFATDQ